MNGQQCAYCPQFSDGETLIKKISVASIGGTSWKPGPAWGRLTLGGGALSCFPNALIGKIVLICFLLL